MGIFLYPKYPYMKDNVSCLTVASTNLSIFVRGDCSQGYLFKCVEFLHMLLFFLTADSLANTFCPPLWQIFLQVSSWLLSGWLKTIMVVLLSYFWNGLDFGSMFWWWQAMVGSMLDISSKLHWETQLYSLSKSTILSFWGVSISETLRIVLDIFSSQYLLYGL